MADAPPREAVREADGSYMVRNEDGSTVRWTRRPDGTWRKPVRTRAGFVAELDQQKYVSKGAELQQQREAQMKAQLGRVPGAPPEEDAGEFSKSRNERKKEKRREKAEEKMEAQWAAADAGAKAEKRDPAGNEGARVAPAVSAGGEEKSAPAQTAEGGAGGKQEKALRKKLKQIEALEEARAAGDALNEDQLAKLAGKAAIEAELHAVLSGEPLPAAQPPPATGYEAAEVPAPAPAENGTPDDAPAAAPEPAAPKNKKAVEKKLRQIAEIEEKAKAGQALNDDQRAKLAAKAQLLAELKALE